MEISVQLENLDIEKPKIEKKQKNFRKNKIKNKIKVFVEKRVKMSYYKGKRCSMGGSRL